MVAELGPDWPRAPDSSASHPRDCQHPSPLSHTPYLGGGGLFRGGREELGLFRPLSGKSPDWREGRGSSPPSQLNKEVCPSQAGLGLNPSSPCPTYPL